MFDEEELQTHAKIQNEIEDLDNDNKQVANQNNKLEKPKRKSSKKSSQDNDFEDDNENENSDDNSNYIQIQKTLPSYITFGDFEFCDKIINLFYSKKLPRFCIINGKAGIGKSYGVNVAISKIFANTNFVCDLTDQSQQQGNPDVLYIKNTSKTGEEDFKNFSKNFINLKDDIEPKLKPFIQKTPLMDGAKFVIIDSLDGLSKAVANSMLKILEEADKHLYIIALSHDITKVLKTIRSRGVIFNVKPPSLSDFNKILSIQNIAVSDISTLYNLSGHSPAVAKLFITAKYETILRQINDSISTKKPIKIEQIDDILTFTILFEFALKNQMKSNPQAAIKIADSINKILSILANFITYNTTQDLTRIAILTEFNKLLFSI